ncbi:MAG: single-stranded DNA-binding protein, partial [Ktedonobacteraceae bacterium]
VYIEGRLTQRKYVDREGVQRTSIDVVANDMEMLSTKSQQSAPTDQFLGEQDDGGLGDLEDHPF